MSSPLELLERYAALLERGLITRDEYDLQKAQLLGDPGATLAGFSGPPHAKTSTPVPSPWPGAGNPGGLPPQVGAYRILGMLGEGGMGRVFRARHRSESLALRQGGDVVVKLMHPSLAADPQYVQRFEREAELGFTLDHPGVVRVFDLVADSGQLAIVMELFEGRTLAQCIREEWGPSPWPQARQWFVEVLAAVAYAHGKGIVHRDIKPANIMLDGRRRPKVVDFGIARSPGSGLTRSGALMGTVAYMAPEQFTGTDDMDQRADIYALGLTLYEVVAGRLPWDECTTDFLIMQRKVSGELGPPTDWYPGIPAHVVECIARATRPTAAERFCDVAEMLAALEAPPPPWVVAPAPPRAQPTTDVAQPVVAPGEGAAQQAPAALLPDDGTPDPPPGPAPKRLACVLDGIRWTMVKVPPGRYTMGPDQDKGAQWRHQHVELTRSFLVATTPVTEALWAQVWRDVATAGREDLGADFPVVRVSWYDAVAFCNRLSVSAGMKPVYHIECGEGEEGGLRRDVPGIERLTGQAGCPCWCAWADPWADGYRLPTEAEWEHAARAGLDTACSGSADPSEVAWFRRNTKARRSVGLLKPNAWGLHDMSGNVWEWCWDWKGPYSGQEVRDPRGPDDGACRVIRGGSYSDGPKGVEVGCRASAEPRATVSPTIGFRIVLSL